MLLNNRINKILVIKTQLEIIGKHSDNAKSLFTCNILKYFSSI